MKEPALYRVVRPIIKLLFNLIYRPTYIGLENIPKKQGVVLAGNHTNIWDCILLMGATKRTIHFLAKDSLSKGLKKIIFSNMGIIKVNRSIHDKNAYDNAVTFLKENKVIGIFPEGTINRTDAVILPFKSGAVRMAKEANVSIIPFTIKGKYRIFRKGPVIRFYQKFDSKKESQPENVRLMEVIESKLKEN